MSSWEEDQKLTSALNELALRYIINLPADELATFERLAFHVEQAFWRYLDDYREADATLPNLTLTTFTTHLFQKCLMLRPFAGHVNQILAAFKAYKRTVPTCGVVLMNASLTQCVLVRSLMKKAAWAFPKGKINHGEEKLACAVRETFEETGFDCAAYIVPELYFELPANNQWKQNLRLFVAVGVPDDKRFETRARMEIAEVRWWPVKDVLWSTRGGVDVAWNVAAFRKQLRDWVKTRRKFMRDHNVDAQGVPVQRELMTPLQRANEPFYSFRFENGAIMNALDDAVKRNK